MNRRPLKTIAAEIATLLKRETRHVIEIGGLLAEAQEQLDENEQWLLWLRDNFSLSIRTAQRYLAAHALRWQIRHSVACIPYGQWALRAD